ncbi:MAG: hypothetical protein M0026_19785 [Nocardiopsaceae bacterium]|nr:hypothetical protein [Nocardiopsaceae bacterium]
MSSARPRSVSVVAILADIPSTGHLGGIQAERFTLGGADLAAQSGGFVDYARRHTDQGHKIVALYPGWKRERAQRAIRFARGAVRSDTIADIAIDLPPLALSLLADQLAYLAPYLPSGLIAALAYELPEHMLVGGWLKNVGNLANIPVSLGQHIGSYNPKITYLAFRTPVPWVNRVRKADPSPSIPFRPVEPVQLLYSSGEKSGPSAFENRFLPVIRAVSTRSLPPQPLGPEYWGSARYTEFVAFSAHPDALTQPARAVRPTICSWCNDQVAGPLCRFCGAVNQLPVGRPPAYTKASEVPPPVNTQPHSRSHGPAQAALARHSHRRQATDDRVPSPGGPVHPKSQQFAPHAQAQPPATEPRHSASTAKDAPSSDQPASGGTTRQLPASSHPGYRIPQAPPRSQAPPPPASVPAPGHHDKDAERPPNAARGASSTTADISGRQRPPVEALAHHPLHSSHNGHRPRVPPAAE